jgi:hypothetical protein
LFWLFLFLFFSWDLRGQEPPEPDVDAGSPEISGEAASEPDVDAGSPEISGGAASELDVDARRREIANEAASELVSMDLGDSSVSLLMSGYWKGTLQASWGLASTPLGTTAISGDSPLLFTQEADLTLSLWIRERWFVEASFMDDYDLNTYRAGYQGLEGEVIQYAGVGNTGLDFPKFPYLDLGGDSPSSFGFYGRFGTQDLTFHT